jgi:hypothetical protein
MRNRIDFVTTDCDDLSCHTGATFIVDLLISDFCSGLPDDLSGYSATMLIFDEDESVVIDTITGVIAEPRKGIVNFTIPADDTADYVVGMYNHQIDLTIATTVYRLGQGYFEVAQ